MIINFLGTLINLNKVLHIHYNEYKQEVTIYFDQIKKISQGNREEAAPHKFLINGVKPSDYHNICKDILKFQEKNRGN